MKMLRAPTMIVVDPLTLEACTEQSENTCKDVLLGLECVPKNAKRCTISSNSNVGNNNEGVKNFGEIFRLEGRPA
jgi:hypothetical protein